MSNQAMDDFKQKLYHYLHAIPAKEVISYGHLAKLAGQPNYARQVGRLLKQLPAGTKLPWHRVVNAKMEVAFAEGSDKYLIQKQRLESEGWILKGRRLTSKQKPQYGGLVTEIGKLHR